MFSFFRNHYGTMLLTIEFLMICTPKRLPIFRHWFLFKFRCKNLTLYSLWLFSHDFCCFLIINRVGIGGDPKLSKQMRSFGTLKWSQWSQKKCSEQLRSSSIDGSCQMVRTGTRKLQKRSVGFWNLDHCDVAVLLTAKILMFLGLGWLWKSKIRSQKSILVKNLIKNIFSVILDNFWLLPQNFVLVTFFRFYQF